MDFKPEGIAPSEIKRGDILFLPDVDREVVFVEHVIPGDGDQVVGLRLTGVNRGKRVTVGIPWANTVQRIGNGLPS